MKYFSADWHINSTNILKYAHRPFKTAEEAFRALVTNASYCIKGDGMLYHVGDLILSGKDRHDKVVDESIGLSIDDIKTNVRANMFLLAGNHDENNGCTADAKYLVLDLNRKYQNVFVGHYPSYNTMNYRGPNSCINLCGHVHNSWLMYYDWHKRVLNINVGVDVWNYMPASDEQICKMLDFVYANWTKFISHYTFSWTRKDYDKYAKEIEAENEKLRQLRKKEKYEKKGLAPEECKRRKIAAMKAKGLI